MSSLCSVKQFWLDGVNHTSPLTHPARCSLHKLSLPEYFCSDCIVGGSMWRHNDVTITVLQRPHGSALNIRRPLLMTKSIERVTHWWWWVGNHWYVALTHYRYETYMVPLIARFMGPSWVPSGADRTQMGPMLAPWTVLSGRALTRL